MSSTGPYDQQYDFAEPTIQSADLAKNLTSISADDAIGGFTDNVKDTWQRQAPSIDRVTEQASALAQSGVDAVRDTSQRLREKAIRASDTSMKYIREEPVKSMLMFAAAGVVLTALVKRMSRSRRHG